MSSSNAPLLAKGARIAGRYRIDGLIAQGGMGAVYAAFDESSGVAVALKRRHVDEGRGVRMFEREYHTLASLKHPRIIEVYDYGIDGNSAYYTMELLDGSDLRELAPLPYRRACRYLRDVASSLALLHARRLLHRDISPRNVRVTSDDRCKLMDFGVLSSFGVPEVLAGTAPFVPPEALGGAPLDQRADLFALGALAYWVLTGRHAYPASAMDELPQVWRTPPLAPSVFSMGASRGAQELERIPAALDVLVLALLGTNPLGRPASAAEVIDRLTAIAGLEPDREPLAAESYLSGGRTVGRTREQARLLQRLETALAGTGTAIVIDADPGLGSSRLLSELAVEAQLHGGTPVVVDAQLQRGAYGVVHELIAKLLESAPEEALAAAEPHASVLAHFSRELRARLPETPALAPRFAPGELRVRVQTALADWLFAIARERPLVLAIDNAQRMDDASGAVLATLAYHVREHRIMLATVIKSGEDAVAPLVVKSLYDTSAGMQLEPLDKPEVDELLGGLFGEVPHLGRLSEHLYRASAGNPQVCLGLVRQLVRSEVIRHVEGVWVLPFEIAPETGLGTLQPHAARVARLPFEARRLAEALSVHRGPVQLERCLDIAEHESIEDVWTALEALTEEEVLGRTESHYHFVHDKLREYLLVGLDERRRRALHRRMGEAFARDAAGEVDVMIDAGFHLVLGGDEGRGADLLATAGLLLGYDSDEMGAAIPSLRAALQVFRKQKRPRQEIAKLLGPLCNAAWYCDMRLASEFGDEAISLLADLLGFSLAARLRPFLGKHLSLYLGLAVAAVRFVFGKGYGGIDGLRATIVMYFNCVLSLGGVAATCLDAERARALARNLEHLTALGKDHAATMSYRFAVLLSQVPTDHLAETVAGYRLLLSRLTSTKPTRDLPEDSRLMMIGGINYAIGALESFRDGEASLDAARALDDVGLKLYAMVADQVRANYHACRGEVELADYFRDRVEMHAVQAGSGWQAEVWAPASAILSTMLAEDVIGMKRTSEELERLAREIPSLRLHATIARAGNLLLRGEAARARDLFASVLGGTASRSFIGWGAISGAHARACIALGDFETAKQICTNALQQLSAEDKELTAMYLILDLELAVADAHLGEREGAVRRIDALIDEHRETGGPVAMGSLHRTRASIAILAGDLETAREHLAEMERRFEPTRNPGLLQQCEKLRGQLASIERDASASLAGDAPSASVTVVDQPFHLDGETSSERSEHCLALILKRTGAREGYLFDARGGELALIAPGNGPSPQEHVVDQVRRDIRSFERYRRRASTELEPTQLTQLTQLTLGSMVTRTVARPKEHDYRSVVLSADGERAIGAAAVLAGERHIALPESLARSLAKALAEHEGATTTVGDLVGEEMSSHDG